MSTVPPLDPTSGHYGEAVTRAPIPAYVEALADNAGPLCFNPAQARARAFGAILGAAVGDSMGLQSVESSDGGTHPGFFRTEVTDFGVLVMRTLSAYFNGVVDNPACDFAARLVQWRRMGFSELGDTVGRCRDESSVVMRVMAHEDFENEPFEAARAVVGPKADNGALVRTIACAFTAVPADWATFLCAATHADERCAASALTLTLLLNALCRIPTTAAIPAATAADPIMQGRGLITGDNRKTDYMRRMMNTKRIEELELGEGECQSYTVKTCAVAVWAFRQIVKTPTACQTADFFKATLQTVIAQKGMTSANAAVAGAILGAALGRDGIPNDWLTNLPHREWLIAEVESFLSSASPTWAVNLDVKY